MHVMKTQLFGEGWRMRYETLVSMLDSSMVRHITLKRLIFIYPYFCLALIMCGLMD